MAIVSANGKYMALENVRVFYDKDTDNIIITSKDPDIPSDSKGFKINVASDKEAGYTLRRMLGEHGIIPGYEEDGSPDLVRKSELPADTPWHTIPLGKHTPDDIAVWDTRKFPNLFISGSAGSGKTAMIRNIIEYCLKHQEQWKVSVFDMRFPVHYAKDFPDITVTEASITAVEAQLSQYVEELRRREEDPSGSRKNILLAVDELTAIISSHDTAFKTPEFEAIKAQSKKICEHLFALAEHGPAVGIHLVIAAQQVYSMDIISMRKFLIHFQTKVICGNVSSMHVRLFTGKDSSPYLKPRIGKSYLLDPTGENIFQATSPRE